MLQSLINNFTVLTTFLFFGNMVWGKCQAYNLHKSNQTKLILGLVLGLFGVALMYYTFPINTYVFADFRQLPILISVSLGGWIAGLVATVIIFVYRLVFLSGVSMASIWGAVNALGTFIIAILILKDYKLSLQRWAWTLGLSAGLSVVVFSIILVENKWVPIGTFCLVFIVGGMFTLAMLLYLKRSDDSLRIMREAAHRDFLTGLFNARAFEVIMEQRIASSTRYRVPITLLLIDIDHFKQVNDTFGHPAGDAVLSQLAMVLRDTFHPGDHIARKGGEEFAVIVDDCDSERIEIIAERLRRNVENQIFILPDGTEHKITISAGSATYPDIVEELLFERADQALYQAKTSGRNRVCRASSI
ncbi:GGDEF domain-containing protein [Paenibacillus vini]|uniref:GGDEF domain-containing protein n=1 Tax=Paenibacillus vini TaxID=1476024 RepID=A0ABQ4MDB7_9BACL|nr:diguanylate cyclase [Paenibacillus vini]GIP53991.1 GGDEF domain-containing protein [Paenibacillus vini]